MGIYYLRICALTVISFSLASCWDGTVVAWGDIGSDDTSDSSGSSEDDTNTANDLDSFTDSDSNTDSASDGPLACSDGLVGWATVNANDVDGTTGGGTATPVVVSTLDELATAAFDANPQVIHVSASIDAGSSALEIGSNKTLIGLGASVVITGGLEINGESNIIIQNLAIQGNGEGQTPEDTFNIEGESHHIWIDHCDIQDAGDDLIGITEGSDFITISWTRFSFTDAAHTHRWAGLVSGGSTSGATDTGKMNTTWHHNWFASLVNQAMPRALFGKSHIFNNYYNAADNRYCIGAGSFAGILIENNYFQDVNDPHIFADTNPTVITATGNVYDNTSGDQDTGAQDNSGEADPFPSPAPYAYSLDAAENVPALVTQCVGPQ